MRRVRSCMHLHTNPIPTSLRIETLGRHSRSSLAINCSPVSSSLRRSRPPYIAAVLSSHRSFRFEHLKFAYPCGAGLSGGAGRKLTALWHVKNLVGVNVLHFEILGGLSMKWSLGKYSKGKAVSIPNFANVVCGAPRGLSESGQVRLHFACGSCVCGL